MWRNFNLRNGCCLEVQGGWTGIVDWLIRELVDSGAGSRWAGAWRLAAEDRRISLKTIHEYTKSPSIALFKIVIPILVLLLLLLFLFFLSKKELTPELLAFFPAFLPALQALLVIAEAAEVVFI